jgi:hypothetical protein
MARHRKIRFSLEPWPPTYHLPPEIAAAVQVDWKHWRLEGTQDNPNRGFGNDSDNNCEPNALAVLRLKEIHADVSASADFLTQLLAGLGLEPQQVKFAVEEIRWEVISYWVARVAHCSCWTEDAPNLAIADGYLQVEFGD